MADSFARFEALKRVSGNTEPPNCSELAALASADAVASAVDSLRLQVIRSTEELIEALYDYSDFDDDIDEVAEEDEEELG